MANLVIVAVGSDGKIALYNSSVGTVEHIADVVGYYLAGPPLAAGAFGSVPAARILDTRVGTGAAKAAVASHAVLSVAVGRTEPACRLSGQGRCAVKRTGPR